VTAPTVQLLLDDGTGAFPYDITAYQEDELTWERGTPDEQSSVNPGSLSLTLDNTDGRFSLNNGTYAIDLDRLVRVKVNGANRWTGRVQSLPVSWPGGSDKYAIVQVTAIDDLARASRFTLQPHSCRTSWPTAHARSTGSPRTTGRRWPGTPRATASRRCPSPGRARR
jgi:hypothetical protein